MRIGVHCFPLGADIGGMKQYFLSLFGELLEHDRENEYVFFYNPKNVPELSALPSRWRENAVELGRASRIKGRLKGLDLYFSPLVLLTPRPLPLPTVITIPDNQEVFFPEFFSAQQKFIREWHYRGSVRMADRVITISEFSKAALVEHYQAAPDKISVAPLCPDSRFYRAAEIAQRPTVVLPEGRFLFYPANRWHHKNHDTLLRALQLLARKGLKLNLVVTGHDVEGGYPVLQKTAEYGVTRQIFPAGYVTVEELAWLYRNARLMVFPSLFEGFGLPLVEAMAAECPILAACAGSMPEVGADAVEYFDPHSASETATAIERVWTRPELRQALVQRGRERVAQFSPARLAEVHLQAFHEARRAYRPLRYTWNALWRQHYDAWAAARKYPAAATELAGKF